MKNEEIEKEIRRAKSALVDHILSYNPRRMNLIQSFQWAIQKGALEAQLLSTVNQKFLQGGKEHKEEEILSIKQDEEIQSIKITRPRNKLTTPDFILKMNQGALPEEALQEEANETIQDVKKALKDTQENDSESFKDYKLEEITNVDQVQVGDKLFSKVTKLEYFIREIKFDISKNTFFFKIRTAKINTDLDFDHNQLMKQFLKILSFTGGADQTQTSNSSGGADEYSATKRKRKELSLVGKFVKQIDSQRVFQVEQISNNIVRTICQETDQVQIHHLNSLLDENLFEISDTLPETSEKAGLLSTEEIESPVQIAIGSRLISEGGAVWKVTELGKENTLKAWKVEFSPDRSMKVGFKKLKEYFKLVQDCQKHKAGVSTYFETEGKLFKVIDESSRFFNEICKVQAEELSGAWIFPISPNNSKEFFFWDQLQYLEDQQ